MTVSVTSLSGANSFQGFRSLTQRHPPSYNNLYWVRFRRKPNVMAGSDFNAYFNNGVTSGPGHDKSRLLTYYATDVTVPSRQITTGEIKSVGSQWKYPTGTSFSEISIQFIVPRTYFTRTFFERWMNYTASDAGQYVSWYDDAVCTYLDIFKYERGGVKPYNTAVYSSGSLAASTGSHPGTVSWNRCIGSWTMQNVYPFNISSMQLQSGPAGSATMEVSFYFERYRFFVPSEASALQYETPASSVGSAGVKASTAALNAALAAGPVPTTGGTPTLITTGGPGGSGVPTVTTVPPAAPSGATPSKSGPSK